MVVSRGVGVVVFVAAVVDVLVGVTVGTGTVCVGVDKIGVVVAAGAIVATIARDVLVVVASPGIAVSLALPAHPNKVINTAMMAIVGVTLFFVRGLLPGMFYPTTRASLDRCTSSIGVDDRHFPKPAHTPSLVTCLYLGQLLHYLGQASDEGCHWIRAALGLLAQVIKQGQLIASEFLIKNRGHKGTSSTSQNSRSRIFYSRSPTSRAASCASSAANICS